MSHPHTGIRISENHRLAARWQGEAAVRRRYSRIDVGADVLEVCAAELLEATRLAVTASTEDTVEDYAAQARVTATTVRRWIRRGKVRARRTAHGWMILRDELGVVTEQSA